MSADVAGVLAEVLAGHELVGKSAPALGWREHGCPMVVQSACQCQRIVIGCTGCDWLTEADGTQADAHRAHVAAEQAKALADSTPCTECGGSQVIAVGLPDIYRACPACCGAP